MKERFSSFFFRIVDNLPCATQFKMIDSDEIQYEHGYKLGFVKDGKVRSTKITDRSSGAQIDLQGTLKILVIHF